MLWMLFLLVNKLCYNLVVSPLGIFGGYYIRIYLVLVKILFFLLYSHKQRQKLKQVSSKHKKHANGRKWSLIDIVTDEDTENILTSHFSVIYCILYIIT